MSPSLQESVSLLGLPPADAASAVGRWVQERSLPEYRAGQILRRLWLAPVAAWQEATELPGGLRSELERDFPLGRLRPETIQQSTDGSRKYLWRLADGEAIESVLIPSGKRLT